MGANRELPALGTGARLLTGPAGPSASGSRAGGGLGRPEWLLATIGLAGLLLVGTLALAGGGRGTAAGTVPAVAPAAPASGWSAAATLTGCALGGSAPLIAFPGDSPDHATGPGAVAWSAGPNCPGGAGVRVAALAPDLVAQSGSAPRGPRAEVLGLAQALALSGAPHGRIVIAGPARAVEAKGAALTEGRAEGPFSPLLAIGGEGPALSLARGYLGDVAIATQARGGSIELRKQRYFRGVFGPPAIVSPRGTGRVQALVAALDYRTDALVAWSTGGAIYARELPASGPPGPLQRLTSAAPQARIAAVISDDHRAIVAWSQSSPAGTSVFLDISAPGARFGEPALVESFPDPASAASPPASPLLVRLSSETVIGAWAGASGGRWVVHVAPIYLNGVQAIDTISAPGANVLLDALAAGPNDEAFVLWGQLPVGGADPSQQAIFAARGSDPRPGETVLGAPEQVAPAGQGGVANVAVDPASGRAVAVWQRSGGAVDYSVRAATAP